MAEKIIRVFTKIRRIKKQHIKKYGEVKPCLQSCLSLLYERVDCWKSSVDYFAEELGFEDSYDMKLFFEERPKLWGGKNAIDMGGKDCVYNEGKKKFHVIENPLTMEGIIHKWLCTAARMRKNKK